MIKKEILNKIFHLFKNQDICLIAYPENIFNDGRANNVTLRSSCLPKTETEHDSNCFTSSLNKKTKLIEAIPVKIIDCPQKIQDDSSSPEQLCVKLHHDKISDSSYEKNYEKDFGGPLICIDEENQKPILTGIGSTAIDFAASDVTGL